RHDVPDFGDDLVGGAAAFDAPHVGDDAIRAALVAAAHDGHVRRHGAVEARDHAFVILEVVLFGPHHGGGVAVAGHGAARVVGALAEKHAFERAVPVGPDHVVHMLQRDGDFLAVVLRHASDHRDAHAGTMPLVMAQGRHARIGLVLRAATDAAGVHHEQIRLVGIFRDAHAAFLQHRAHEVGVVLV